MANLEQTANVLDKFYGLIDSHRVLEYFNLEENDRVLTKKGTDKDTKDDVYIHIYKEYIPRINLDKKFNDLSTDNVYIILHNTLMEDDASIILQICVKEYTIFDFIEIHSIIYKENEICISDNTINIKAYDFDIHFNNNSINNKDIDSRFISKIDDIIFDMLDNIVKRFKVYMERHHEYNYIMHVLDLAISIDIGGDYILIIDNKYLSYLNNLLTSIELENIIPSKKYNINLNITNEGVKKIIEKRNALYRETGVYFNIFREGNVINYIADDGLKYYVDLSEKNLGFYLRTI